MLLYVCTRVVGSYGGWIFIYKSMYRSGLVWFVVCCLVLVFVFLCMFLWDFFAAGEICWGVPIVSRGGNLGSGDIVFPNIRFGDR